MKTLTTLLFLLLPSCVLSAERVALLIGCSNYTDLHELTTPVNDATALKTTLESPALGFECLPVVKNASLEKFYEALDSFQAKAKDARVALIFYSGHGIEHDGVNYLIPVSAELNTATQLKTQALNVSAVMEALGKTNATAKLAILDCCRDNPFKVTKSWTATKSVRDEVLKELGEADIPQSTLVCFATSAGRKAAAVLNDSSTNSPFTQFLLKEIQTPGLSLRDVFERVHDTLETSTEGRQVPAVKTDNALSKVFRQTVLVTGAAPPVQLVKQQTSVPAMPRPSISRSSTAEATPSTGTLEEIKIEFPKPMFVGTPIPSGDVPNLEQPLPKDRVAKSFVAPRGTANVALGKKVTSSDSFPIIPLGPESLKLITDGDADASDGHFVELAPGPQWIQIDLGARHEIHKLIVWHYHKQAIVVKDFIVQVSDDPEFKRGVVTIYNADHDNTLKLGAGSDMAYVETNYGRMVDGKGSKGRYLRLYSNGSTMDDFNRYIEVSVYGVPVQ